MCRYMADTLYFNVSEMINEWGAYAGVLPQTADPQLREVLVHKESLQMA